MRCLWLTLPFAFLGTAGLADAQKSPGPVTAKVKFVSGKDSVSALQIRPPGHGPFPAVVVLHGDFGLTPWVKKQSYGLADNGYLVLAVDLYGGDLPATVEEAHILERGLDERRVLANLKAAVDFLESLALVRKDSIGILGWDCGGGFALDAAIADRRLKTAVMCYGRVTTDPKKLASLEGHVLALFGGKDEGIPPATIDQFRKAMAKAGKSATIHVYPTCGNSFMDPESPYFEGKADPAAIADAWAKIDANLEKALKKPQKE
jgi:carboxymethylenebutenolidase